MMKFPFTPNRHEVDAHLERLASLREQFEIAAKVHPKLFHATRVVIDPLTTSSDNLCQGWEEFLPREHFFEFNSYERLIQGVQHSCFYVTQERLREYTGLAAAGLAFLTEDLCLMTDSHRNAFFDRDIWTLALYRIAMHEEFK